MRNKSKDIKAVENCEKYSKNEDIENTIKYYEEVVANKDYYYKIAEEIYLEENSKIYDEIMLQYLHALIINKNYERYNTIFIRV